MQAPLRCKNCNSVVAPGDPYCNVCGFQLAPAATPQPTSSELPQPSVAQQPVQPPDFGQPAYPAHYQQAQPHIQPGYTPQYQGYSPVAMPSYPQPRQSSAGVGKVLSWLVSIMSGLAGLALGLLGIALLLYLPSSQEIAKSDLANTQLGIGIICCTPGIILLVFAATVYLIWLRK